MSLQGRKTSLLSYVAVPTFAEATYSEMYLKATKQNDRRGAATSTTFRHQPASLPLPHTPPCSLLYSNNALPNRPRSLLLLPQPQCSLPTSPPPPHPPILPPRACLIAVYHSLAPRNPIMFATHSLLQPFSSLVSFAQPFFPLPPNQPFLPPTFLTHFLPFILLNHFHRSFCPKPLFRRPFVFNHGTERSPSSRPQRK